MDTNQKLHALAIREIKTWDEDAYREMYDDGLTPSQARSEEYDAACWAAS